jgi:hypothetical protein
MKTKQFLNGAMDLAGKSYQLKYNIRAIVLFEKIADKPFTLACTSDWVIFLYAMLLSGAHGATQEATITFDDFVDAISQQQVKQAIAWTREQMENEAEAV